MSLIDTKKLNEIAGLGRRERNVFHALAPEVRKQVIDRLCGGLEITAAKLRDAIDEVQGRRKRPMTLLWLSKMPIGTTEIVVGRNENFVREGFEFMAVHYEVKHKAVKPVVFYAATEAEAREKAESYDALRKAKFESWKSGKSRKSGKEQNYENTI